MALGVAEQKGAVEAARRGERFEEETAASSSAFGTTGRRLHCFSRAGSRTNSRLPLVTAAATTR
jgi:hypothetical protein